MVTIERTNYAFAEINASPEEWEGVKAMIKHAVDVYDKTDLDYLIQGDAETRNMRLRQLSEKLVMFDEAPVSLHKEDLQILLIVVFESDRTINPHLDDKQSEVIRSAFAQYNIQTIFDDSLTDDSKLAL